MASARGHTLACRTTRRLARVRGQVKLAADFALLAADFALLAAAVNLARLAILGAWHASSGWVLPTDRQ
jgi:hypothetical protein